MAPPKLAADAPILDVFKPVFISVLVFLWEEFNLVAHHRWQCDVGEMLHLQEPLCRQLWLDRHVCALGESHLVIIVLHFLHEGGIFKINGDLLSHIHSVLTNV